MTNRLKRSRTENKQKSYSYVIVTTKGTPALPGCVLFSSISLTMHDVHVIDYFCTRPN